jgi:L-lactate dehydrogenase (cytochrome)
MADTRPDPRRLPRWSQLRDLLVLRSPHLDPVRRRLAVVHTVADLRRIARRRVPRPVFDYVDGAAEAERSLAEARRCFAQVRFHPRVLRDVAEVDTGTDILGVRARLPLVLAPTGFTRMMHHEGERAVAPAARAAGVPFALSTMGTTPIEGVDAAAPGGRHWFQLYLARDTALSEEMISRAAAAGWDTLLLTVDTPVASARLRDVRNGLTIPPSLTPSTLASMAAHPAWWANLLTTAPLEFALLRDTGLSPAQIAAQAFNPSLTFDALAWIREQWPGALVVKGVQSLADARALAEVGVEGIVVSNHGGRQLDRAVSPLSLVGEVKAAVGERMQVLLDGGITSGGDIAAAVAAGADACMVGRAYLYGLMAAGRPGVGKALAILAEEFTRTMRLLGARSVAELVPDMVTVPGGR